MSSLHFKANSLIMKHFCVSCPFRLIELMPELESNTHLPIPQFYVSYCMFVVSKQVLKFFKFNELSELTVVDA